MVLKIDALAAPQANLMAAVIKSSMSREPVTWILYGVGASVTIVMEMAKVPSLAFALGMYLPLHLTTPLVVGGFIAHLVKGSTRDKELAEKRHNRGTLICSGFIAGGALIGIILAILKMSNLDHFISWGIPMIFENGLWVDGPPAAWYSSYGEITRLIAFVLLIWFVYSLSKKAK